MGTNSPQFCQSVKNCIIPNVGICSTVFSYKIPLCFVLSSLVDDKGHSRPASAENPRAVGHGLSLCPLRVYPFGLGLCTLSVHRCQKISVAFGSLHLIEEKFHGIDGVQRGEQFSENPDTIEVIRRDQQFFLACA